MRVHLSGHHVEVTPALRRYVDRKLGRIVKRFDRLIDVHCVLTVEKLRHRAESTVRLSGSTLHAAATEDDMYAAIDALFDKLEEQVRRHKEKARARRTPVSPRPAAAAVS